MPEAIRDSKRYKGITSNWDDFCLRYLGLSRARG
jgi:hypothetical protein